MAREAGLEEEDALTVTASSALTLSRQSVSSWSAIFTRTVVVLNKLPGPLSVAEISRESCWNNSKSNSVGELTLSAPVEGFRVNAPDSFPLSMV